MLFILFLLFSVVFLGVSCRGSQKTLKHNFSQTKITLNNDIVVDSSYNNVEIETSSLTFTLQPKNNDIEFSDIKDLTSKLNSNNFDIADIKYTQQSSIGSEQNINKKQHNSADSLSQVISNSQELNKKPTKIVELVSIRIIILLLIVPMILVTIYIIKRITRDYLNTNKL